MVWAGPDGEERRKSFASKDVAEEWRTGVDHEVRSGTYVSREAGLTPLSEFWPKFLKSKARIDAAIRDIDVSAWEKYIKPEFGYMAITDFHKREVEIWLAGLTVVGADEVKLFNQGKPLSPSTEAKNLTVLRELGDLAVDARALNANPHPICEEVQIRSTAAAIPHSAARRRPYRGVR